MEDTTGRNEFLEEVASLAFLLDIEKTLSLPETFVEKPINEDDWSFIIKLHALLEASVTHMPMEKFCEPSLVAVFSRLEMTNFQSGKMAFVGRLDLLDKPSRNFIQKLSELRNQFVHDVANVNNSFDTFFGALPETRRNEYFKVFKFGYKGQPSLKDLEADARLTVLELVKWWANNAVSVDLKLAIWIGGMLVMFQINHAIKRSLRGASDTGSKRTGCVVAGAACLGSQRRRIAISEMELAARFAPGHAGPNSR